MRPPGGHGDAGSSMIGRGGLGYQPASYELLSHAARARLVTLTQPLVNDFAP